MTDDGEHVYHGRSTVTFGRLLNDIEPIDHWWCQWAITDDDGKTYACRLERYHAGEHVRDTRTSETQEIVVSVEQPSLVTKPL